MQHFKSVYYSDYPSGSSKQRNLTMAFGPGDIEVFECICGLSSEEMRQLLGTSRFVELRGEAERAGISLNALCLRRLRASLSASSAARTEHDETTTSVGPHFDPLHATFRGGIEEPLHQWYPYLEGYSPRFVERVIEEFASGCEHVLDPFAGAGTTPLTAAKMGISASYCELNPLLQLVAEAKAEALALVPIERAKLDAELATLSQELRLQVESCAPDQRLDRSYAATFGASRFFSEQTYEAALRLRTWLDGRACASPRSAMLVSVAIAASLVPASNLIRRGDLRFRKGDAELQLMAPDLINNVVARLGLMRVDLARMGTTPIRPQLVASDAKRLSRCTGLEVDAVVTSPPYLNGTNYYRNTKIELWFLRALESQSDLAAFRKATVTAGINDVTTEKSTIPPSEAVASLASTLSERAYDARIPQMVLSYFSDIDEVMKGLATVMRPMSTLVMDIGDSAYSGLHVDTPRLLCELLRSRGWRIHREVLLRQRLSRGGLQLRQVLVVAQSPQTARTGRAPQPRWRRSWNAFKKELPHQQGEYSRRNWGSPLHSLCSFQGKMKPSLARHLALTFAFPGARVLDPFGGVGTIPFEVASLGAKSWSFDLSPAAVPVSFAKLKPATSRECAVVLGQLAAFLRAEHVSLSEYREADLISFNGRVADYFHPETFREILLSRRFFQLYPPSEAPASSLVFASLLHVLHGNRPYALSRRSHPITPFAPSGVEEYKSVLDKVSEKVERALAVERPPEFVPGESLLQDATSLWPSCVDDLDVVLTSPPFFDSTRFYLANWMRLWLAGWSAEDFARKPSSFVDDRQKKSFDVYQAVLRQARERLKSGGVCVFHLGRSPKCDMAVEIARVARPWFARAEVFHESVEHCESHGIRDKGTVTAHSYLILF